MELLALYNVEGMSIEISSTKLVHLGLMVGYGVGVASHLDRSLSRLSFWQQDQDLDWGLTGESAGQQKA